MERFVVEGAGGVLVPLNESELMVDLIRQLGLPALVVARSTLGTINHTLMTLEILGTRAIDVVGVVMVGPPNAANREAIESFGKVQVLGQLPLLTPLTPESLKAWAMSGLDAPGRLQDLLA
jgi:dethiobiotin synthetase